MYTYNRDIDKLLQEEKLSCLDMAVPDKQTKIEEKLEVLPLRKQNTD